MILPEGGCKEIKAVILNLKGKITGTEYSENRNVLAAEIVSRQMIELIQKLEIIGDVRKKAQYSGPSALALVLRIIIVTH